MSDETQTAGTQDAPVETDTAPAQTSEASETNTNEAPEATQAVEEKQTDEVKATDTAEDKLYAGKYKTPEEMEKAYKELESKFGATTSEKAELTRILNEAFTTPEPTPAQDDSLVETDPLAEKVDRLDRQTAVQNFIFAHPDANPSAMNEVLTKDPVIGQIPGHDAKLEYAYFKSQNMTSQKAIAEAKKSSANEATAKIVEKQAAQVESAKKADSTDESSELRERATGNYDQATRDKARLELIRKNLVNL
jgi:hypothetical protein